MCLVSFILIVLSRRYVNETAELITKLLEEIVLDLAAAKNADMALHLAVAMLQVRSALHGAPAVIITPTVQTVSQHSSISSHCAGLVYDLFKVAKMQNAASAQLQVWFQPQRAVFFLQPLLCCRCVSLPRPPLSPLLLTRPLPFPISRPSKCLPGSSNVECTGAFDAALRLPASLTCACTFQRQACDHTARKNGVFDCMK